jgi:hypothetical protein
VRLAARGSRETEKGSEPVTDTWLARELKRQARDIVVQSLLAATVLTALTLLVPARAF